MICRRRGSLRWVGSLPVLNSISQPWLTLQPDVVIDESGRVQAFSIA